MRRIYYKLFIRWLALRWMFQINLGNRVWHEGELWRVDNGVAGWTLRRVSDNMRKEYVPREEVKLQITPTNLLSSYRYGVRFYEGYWLDIWVRNGIEDWVKRCRIWPWPSKR